MYSELNKSIHKIQEEAITHYGYNFNETDFYSKIAQNKKYINSFNQILNKYEINIDYYSRIKDESGEWIIDTIHIPIFVQEPE